MTVSVILCTFNRSASLKVTLDSLARVRVPSGTDVELVVVDNNSCDDTREVVGHCAPRMPFTVRYFFEPRQGKSFALNQGLSRSRGELIAFTDDDVRMDEEWLCEAVSALERHPQVWGCAGKILLDFPSRAPAWLAEGGRFKTSHFFGHYDLGGRERLVNSGQGLPFGANWFLRREAVEKVGLFDTSPEIGKVGDRSGVEEIDYGVRVLEMGGTFVYVPQAVIWHRITPGMLARTSVVKRLVNMGRSTIRSERRNQSPGVRYILWCARSAAWDLARAALSGTRGGRQEKFFHESRAWLKIGSVIGAVEADRDARSSATPVKRSGGQK